MGAYEQLASVAAELQLPEHYKDDLTVHDRRILAKHKPEFFGWVLRDCGTNMFFPDRSGIAHLLYHIRSGEEHFYVYRDNKLSAREGMDLLREMLEHMHPGKDLDELMQLARRTKSVYWFETVYERVRRRWAVEEEREAGGYVSGNSDAARAYARVR